MCPSLFFSRSLCTEFVKSRSSSLAREKSISEDRQGIYTKPATSEWSPSELCQLQCVFSGLLSFLVFSDTECLMGNMCWVACRAYTIFNSHRDQGSPYLAIRLSYPPGQNNGFKDTHMSKAGSVIGPLEGWDGPFLPFCTTSWMDYSGGCQCSFLPICIVGCSRLPTQWSCLQKGTGVEKGEKIKLLVARASRSSSTWGWCTHGFFSCTHY